jgi:ABC-type Fe3+-hydroxamate transport system substrate-binding protein
MGEEDRTPAEDMARNGAEALDEAQEKAKETLDAFNKKTEALRNKLNPPTNPPKK